MFQIAVLGPQFADRLGVVQQCLQCRSAAGSDAPPCPGYGPGCLVTPRANARDALAGCEGRART
jgi:hypothetical protein